MIQIFLALLLTFSTSVLAQNIQGTTKAPPNIYSTPNASLLNPVGTTNTTGVMMGMGSTATIVAGSNGVLLFTIQGQISNSSTGGGGMYPYYGTGVAPSNGAALTGTLCTGSVGFTVEAAAGSRWPISVDCKASGLTPGTTYWIDGGVRAITTGTATINNISINAVSF